ncbi:MAG: XRE family transcriptional regulator [Xanthobacteraceae bacterium]|nr:MAG: XRE family transcriptional regulator [Xanthobacteraceae bacterium]
MDVQIFKTPSGEEMVVLPRAEYEALLARAADAGEDDADVAVYDARMAALTAGADEVLPSEVSSNVLRGHSVMKAVRLWRGVLQADLARNAHVSQGFISDLESGKKRADEATLDRIATALNVPLRWLARG